RLTARERANLILALWALVIVGFFSFSTRQEYYTVPALPALALLVGGWLGKESATAPGSPARRAGKISSVIMFGALALASMAGTLLLKASHPPPPGTDLAELLRKNPQEYDLSLGHFLDLTPAALGAFRGPLTGAILSLFIGSGANLILRKAGRTAAGNAALALMMVGLLSCVHSAFVTFSPILSSKQLALAIRDYYEPGDTIVVDGEYHQASCLNFYTGVPLHVLHQPSGNLWYGAKFSDAPHVFETPATLAALWSGTHTVFLWTDQSAPKELGNAPRIILASEGGKFILINHELKP
ncbi:MAG: phospholipid carrier-dependent glycosyltransferase, partial [Acidobacteriales bacterium]|nr:phospholipid carrier-dependent glycosyltransferase [Terriglobales bacterium]